MSATQDQRPRVAVVIPCYRVKEYVLDVIARCGPEIDRIFCVDDCCPQQSGTFIEAECRDPRVKVIFHKQNQGVGGATISGWREATREGCEVIVKVDGDGQMDPQLVSRFAGPILSGLADYTKGNRFFRLDSLTSMPPVRLMGNAVLSFLTKAASGYWDLMDPTNGFTAISTRVVKLLPLEKIDRRFFFESDVLFRLNTVRAVVKEVPMDAHYNHDQSNLKIVRDGIQFPFKLLRCLAKRVFYSYFLRDFNVCTIQMVLGAGLFFAGAIFGFWKWIAASQFSEFASAGTVMLAALPVIMGFQLILAAISFDLGNVPRTPLSRILSSGDRRVRSETEPHLSVVGE